MKNTQQNKLENIRSLDLNDDRVCWKIHSPGKSGCTDQHLQEAFRKHGLHQIAVRPQHTSMMNPKAFWKHLLHLLVSGALDLTNRRSRRANLK